MNKIHVSKRGFTLIELLIVIAIVAVLAVAVVLILNPAELLKQGRDSVRISDLGAINGVLGLWLADVTNTSSWGSGGTTRCTSGDVEPGSAVVSCTANAIRTTGGLGWVGPVDLGLISGGSPLSLLPIDPSNGDTTCAGVPAVCFYAFEPFSTVGKYKLGANMESLKYGWEAGQTDSNDVESATKDSGTVPTWHETGTAVSTVW